MSNRQLSEERAVVEYDVLVFGTVFLDLVFENLPAPPKLGTEIFADGLTWSPGGAANVAVALARLGVRTGLVASLGRDLVGEWLAQALHAEGVDLAHARRPTGWPQPTTVSLVAHGERAMITHQQPGPPTSDLPVQAARVYFEYLSHTTASPSHTRPDHLDALRVCDIGWDAHERWSPATLVQLDGADVFTPNAAEAMAFTRTDSPIEAARELAERVPLAVVKCGELGVVAIDSARGALVAEPALPVTAVDTTGAGDTFDAGFIYATLQGWPVADQLAFGNLCAGISVTRRGGAVAAPTWADIHAVLATMPPQTRERFGFLPPLAALALPSPVSHPNHDREVPVV